MIINKGTLRSKPERSSVLGVLAALFATFSWSLNFMSPYMTGGYSTFDAVVVRFIFCGLIGAAILWVNRRFLAAIRLHRMVVAASLGLVGYAGYVACIMLSVIYAGPVIPPAIVGTVPVIVALIGNSTTKSMSWGRLAVPLLLISMGLGAINVVPLVETPPEGGRALLAGIGFSALAVSLWVLFSVFNQRYLAVARDANLGAWTGLMMFGTGVGVALCFPFGVMMGLSKFPELGFGSNAIVLYASAFALAGVSSVAGAWAWNIAVRQLPLVVTGQMISIETLFATLFGLLALWRFPSWNELTGISFIVLGTVLGVRVIFGEPDQAERSATH